MQHGILADVFRNDLAQSILYGKDPEAIIRAMDSPTAIRNIEKMLDIADKPKVMAALKRYKLESWLQDAIIQGAESEGRGELKAGAGRFLTKHQNKELLEALTTPQQRQNRPSPRHS